MIWEAPAWSQCSPQFTHGFLRRLVDAKHGGFLPGNVIVSAQASNLALRRLAVCDVASLASKNWLVAGGLSLSRLLNLRHAALKYTSGSYLPQYLIRGMLDTGVSFATFDKLDGQTLDELSEALPAPWKGELEESSEDEPQQVTPRVMTSIGQQPMESDGERAGLLESLLYSSASHGLSAGEQTSEEDADDESDGDGADPGGRPTGGQPKAAEKKSRKRKRAKKGSSSASSSGRDKRAVVPTALVASSASSSTAARADPMGVAGLAALPLVGLKLDVFPSGDAMKGLFDYFSQHLPLSSTVGSLLFFIGNATIMSRTRFSKPLVWLCLGGTKEHEKCCQFCKLLGGLYRDF